MASIDKTYCKKEEYILARQFWIDTYEEQVRLFESAQWLYPFTAFKEVEITPDLLKKDQSDLEYYLEDDEWILWNTGSSFDLWLSKTCELEFIQERLKGQYGDNWIGFTHKDDLDFSERPFIYEIHYGVNDPNIIYFYENSSEGAINLDKMIFFGSTYFYKIIHDAKESLNHSKVGVSTIVNFEYYGLTISCKNGIHWINDENVCLGRIDVNHFDFPKIKYSFNANDVDDYSEYEVYFSEENSIYALTDYKDYDKESINRYIYMLPKYLSNLICKRRKK